jgi:hypothetical protein
MKFEIIYRLTTEYRYEAEADSRAEAQAMWDMGQIEHPEDDMSTVEKFEIVELEEDYGNQS